MKDKYIAMLEKASECATNAEHCAEQACNECNEAEFSSSYLQDAVSNAMFAVLLIEKVLSHIAKENRNE